MVTISAKDVFGWQTPQGVSIIDAWRLPHSGNASLARRLWSHEVATLPLAASACGGALPLIPVNAALGKRPKLISVNP